MRMTDNGILGEAWVVEHNCSRDDDDYCYLLQVELAIA